VCVCVVLKGDARCPRYPAISTVSRTGGELPSPPPCSILALIPGPKHTRNSGHARRRSGGRRGAAGGARQQAGQAVRCGAVRAVRCGVVRVRCGAGLRRPHRPSPAASIPAPPHDRRGPTASPSGTARPAHGWPDARTRRHCRSRGGRRGRIVGVGVSSKCGVR
jgi:hypothetical protein